MLLDDYGEWTVIMLKDRTMVLEEGIIPGKDMLGLDKLGFSYVKHGQVKTLYTNGQVFDVTKIARSFFDNLDWYISFSAGTYPKNIIGRTEGLIDILSKSENSIIGRMSGRVE